MFFECAKKLKSINLIEAETLYPEKVLNLIQLKGVAVWNVTYQDSVLAFKCFSHDCGLIKSVCGPYVFNFILKQSLGFQNIKKFVRNRRLLVMLALLCVGCVVFLSQFIWQIEIYALRQTSKDEVLKYLYSVDVKQSMLKKKLNPQALSVDMLLYFNEFSDVFVEVKGTKLLISVTEKESPAVIYDTSFPVNIIAKEDCTLDYIEVYNGYPMVEAGKVVKKGDVLISGSVKIDINGTESVKKVHSIGKVLSYKEEVFDDIFINMYEPEACASYESEKTYYIFGKTFTVSDCKDTAEKMFVETKNNNVSLWWFEIPVLYDEIKWYNIKKCTQKSEYELAEEIYKLVSEKIGAKASVMDVTYSVEYTQNYVINVKAKVKYAENIGIEQLIE